jgi:hypothetical protein
MLATEEDITRSFEHLTKIDLFFFLRLFFPFGELIPLSSPLHPSSLALSENTYP